MRKSWKSVAETLAAYMPMEALHNEQATLASDGKRMLPAEHAIAFLEARIKDWESEL